MYTVLTSDFSACLSSKLDGWTGYAFLDEVQDSWQNSTYSCSQSALEQVFKQILGGCSGVVHGLGTFRNKHGDTHGDKPKSVKQKNDTQS
ncbi:abortive infection family protein [Vibrio splendidus]|uniref:Abortive infection protein-like C-terminal domain-containing protein n=1 Tax=Vibrio splendidus TaxID=29497 RepID=A0A837NYW4_VIBSP|nr:abortive infection family protein [Vibrio splendidus]KPL95406.1 hypothetical protein AN168_07120 [Vibrio splendidus]